MQGLAAFQPAIGNVLSVYNTVDPPIVEPSIDEEAQYYARRQRLENILRTLPNESNNLASDYRLLAQPLSPKGLAEAALFFGGGSGGKLARAMPTLAKKADALASLDDIELTRGAIAYRRAKLAEQEKAALRNRWILELYDKYGADLSEGLLYGNTPRDVNNITPQYVSRLPKKRLE